MQEKKKKKKNVHLSLFLQEPAKYCTYDQWIAGAILGSYRLILQLTAELEELSMGYKSSDYYSCSRENYKSVCCGRGQDL